MIELTDFQRWLVFDRGMSFERALGVPTGGRQEFEKLWNSLSSGTMRP